MILSQDCWIIVSEYLSIDDILRLQRLNKLIQNAFLYKLNRVKTVKVSTGIKLVNSLEYDNRLLVKQMNNEKNIRLTLRFSNDFNIIYNFCNITSLSLTSISHIT